MLIKNSMINLNIAIIKNHTDTANHYFFMQKCFWCKNLEFLNVFLLFLIPALDDGDGEEAHHIHVSIIVDHVAEVRDTIHLFTAELFILYNNCWDHCFTHQAFFDMVSNLPTAVRSQDSEDNNNFKIIK